MSIAFRSDNEVVNGTAGTSVTVTKPAGIVDTGPNSGRDHLIAFIAFAGTTGITPPADWILVGSQVASTNVTLAVYRKLASSEGANWTWTLGTSLRNWGWVGAYTGVDPDNPIADFNESNATTPATVYTTDPVAFLRPEGRFIAAVATTRTASGTATTWTALDSERADMSTNAGAGVDIAGCVTDGGGSGMPNPTFNTFTASQTQAQGVTWAITLTPYFTPYTGDRIAPIVEAAFGADPDGAPALWSWTPISDYVLTSDIASITISKGRKDEAGRASPTEVRLVLKNLDGRFSIDNPNSPYWPNLRRNLPIRVSVPFGFTPPTERATAFVSAWRPRWDTSTRAAVIDVVASGRLRRLNRRRALRSAMYRTFSGITGDTVTPAAYWPCEDESNATRAASTVAGVAALSALGGVSFAAESTLPGSAPLPTLPSGARLAGVVPAYTATGKWCTILALRVPAEPSVATHLLYVRTTGTARTWTITLVPGSPGSVAVRAYDSSATQILSNSISLAAIITEADFYAHWAVASISVVQSGPDIDYTLRVRATNGNTLSVSGTLASNTHGNVASLTALAQATTPDVSFGHLAVYTDPAFDVTLDPNVLPNAMDGHVGEQAKDRFGRLCGEEGIPHVSVHKAQFTAADLTMGRQPVGSLIDAFQECEDLDAGVIHDGGFAGLTPGLLAFVSRTSRYNAAVTLTLDMANGQLSPAFEPEFDDQRLVNEVTASRDGGSSAVVPVPASIATDGLYGAEGTLNVEGDTLLNEIAGWHAHVGTADGMRYPQLSLNLRRTPSLTQQWLDVRVGSRVQAVNLMATHPSDVDAFVEGYAERISKTWWSADLSCSPAFPYIVGVFDSATLGRLDTSGSQLAAAITTTATSAEVATTSGPVWDTTSEPFDAWIAGEQVTVTTVAPSTVTFVATGTVAHANNADVTPGLPAGRAAGDLLLVFAAIRNSGTGTPNIPTGFSRLLDMGNAALFGRIATNTSADQPTISFTGGVANADTSAQMVAFRGPFHNVDRVVTATNECLNGSAQNILYPPLKVYEPNTVVVYLGWKQDDWTSVATISGATEISEPATTTGDDQGLVWDYVIQTTAANIRAGGFAVTGGADAISRGAVVAFRADKQTWTITRSVNGIVKAHSAAAAVRLWQPLYPAL